MKIEIDQNVVEFTPENEIAAALVFFQVVLVSRFKI